MGVSWDEAKAFCAWLTETERKAHHISEKQEYRLPTDAEWSKAVGKSKYPWGNEWPPPEGAGNYFDDAAVANLPGEGWKQIPGNDGFAGTSPVGSFKPNPFGLYDVSGNVRQWCEDWYRKEMNEKSLLDKYPNLKEDGGGEKYRVVRGASWDVSAAERLLSFGRGGYTPGRRYNYCGFRCVLSGLEIVSAKDEKSSVPLESLPQSAPPNATGAQTLTRVYVKKYGVSALLPTDVFPDAKKLSESDQSFLQGNSWSRQTTLTFSSVREPLAKVYAECATEHSPQAPSKTVQYKVLKPTWFVVSGDLGPQADASLGFYTKGVKKDSFVVIMHFQWREDDFPFSEETFTAMSREFDGN